jgi:hypothetical protein
MVARQSNCLFTFLALPRLPNTSANIFVTFVGF